MNRRYGKPFEFFLCILLCVVASAEAAEKSWRAPVDATSLGCNGALAQGVLMDDGTLLLGCTNQEMDQNAINAPLWQRASNGEWSTAASPPTSGSKVVSITKLSGTVAMVTWFDYYNQGTLVSVDRLQFWTSGQGVGPAFQVPGPADQPRLNPLRGSWGLDDQGLRIRSSRAGEFPLPSGATGISVIEQIDKVGQPVGPSLPLPARRVRGDAASCFFPNGDKLVAFLSGDAKGLYPPDSPGEVQAAILRKSGGWEGPVTLAGDFAKDFAGVKALCLSNGVARVLMSFGSPPRNHYVDLAGSDGWGPKQGLVVSGFPPPKGELDAVMHARSPDGRAIVAWNFPQPSGDVLTGQPGHTSIPVIHWLQAGSKRLTADFSMPVYNPDAPADVGVRAVAWDPKRERFIFVLVGGPGPVPRRMFVDFSPGGSWSTATPLPEPMLSNWQLDFNGAGDGVLLANRHGQLLISEWR